MKSVYYFCLIVFVIGIVVGCNDRTFSPNQPDSNVEKPEINSEKTAGKNFKDIGMKMRKQIRSMSDDSLKKLVKRSNLTVMIGFRKVGKSRGVSKDGSSLLSQQQTENKVNKVIEKFAGNIIYRFKYIPAVLTKLATADVAIQLRKLPWVDYIAPGSGLVTPDAVTSSCSPISSPQTIPWNIHQVGADEVWSQTTGDAPKALVVLDDGADEENGSFSNELYWEAYHFYASSSSLNGEHGTPVLGAAQANDNSLGTVGVAPDAVARVMKIFDPNDTNWEGYSAMAIDDNATLATVFTISYSTKITSSDPPPSFVGLHDAIVNAYNQHDVLFTASTGNQGRSDYYAFPANFDEVIGVGGSDHYDEYVYNNYAPGNVEIAAPAVNIQTVCKGGDIGSFDGTSFATPMVAGAVMLLREQNPSWSNAQVRQQLQNTAVPMSNTQKSGAGRLDVAGAIGVEPSLSVSISGPFFLNSDEQGTWTAQVSNNEGSVSYKWYRRQTLSDPWTYSNVTTQSYTTSFYNLGPGTGEQSSAVKVDVISAGESDSATFVVSISSSDCNSSTSASSDSESPDRPPPCN